MADFCCTCALAVALLTASLFAALRGEQTVNKAGFLKTLTPPLLERYQGIVMRRRRLYIESLALGIALSVATILYLTRVAKRKMGLVHGACVAGAVTLGTSYFYYMLHPKNEYMVPHLTTGEQRAAWFKVYREHQIEYSTGLLVGLLGSVAMGTAFCS